MINQRKKLSCIDCTAPCLMKHISSKEGLTLVEENKTLIQCSKNQKIFHEGMPVNSISFINSGIVKVFKTGFLGKNHIIRFSTLGSILGHRGLVAKYYPVSAATMTPASICLFPRNFFMELLEMEKKLCLELLLFFAKELESSELKEFHMAQLNVREKVAECLLFLSNTFGLGPKQIIQLSLSRQDFADFAGTTKEQVSKMLSEFKADGIIDMDKKDIFIKNEKALQRISAAHFENA